MNEAVFLDTSGLYAVLDADDASHPWAAQAFEALVDSSSPLHTSSYVLVELIALLQRRLGLAAVEALATYVLPWVHVSWVDEIVHGQAAAALAAAARRDVSLVDHVSFVLMRRLGVRRVLAVDNQFVEQGFVLA
jgi:uncharacterized protein